MGNWHGVGTSNKRKLFGNDDSTIVDLYTGIMVGYCSNCDKWPNHR